MRHGWRSYALRAAFLLFALLIALPATFLPHAAEDSTVEPPRKVLTSALAGSWYEANDQRLRKEIQSYLDNVKAKPHANVRALIQPHAGYRWSGPVAAYGIREVAGQKFTRVVVIGPSHRVGMENVASIPAVTHYRTPLGDVPLDGELIAELRKHRVFQSDPQAHAREHSVQIQVPLLQHALGEFRLVPVVVGELDLEAAREIARILSGLIDERTLVIASSDFTHYGQNFEYVPFRDDIAENIKKLDMGAFATIEKRSAAQFTTYIAETGATICGRHAIKVLLEMLGPDAQVHRLRYDTSGRKTKDYSHSVSYLSIAVSGPWPAADPVPVPAAEPALGEKERGELLRLARRTLRFVLEKRTMPTLEQIELGSVVALRQPSGAFVSLYTKDKKDHLRGCIGQILPRYPLYKTVMRQAVNAALFDSRFPRVDLSELPELRVEISVLGQPYPVASSSDIVIGKHGIILEKEGRRAVYLPHVATEQGWDLRETLSHLSRKAGLPADAWQEGASFTVFEAQVFGEPKI